MNTSTINHRPDELDMDRLGINARGAARQMMSATGKAKADALRLMADLLLSRKEFLQAENAKDLAAARQAGLAAPLLDRLALSDNALHTMAAGLRQIADMPDPIGGMTASVIRPNGMRGAQMRVPLGRCEEHKSEIQYL